MEAPKRGKSAVRNKAIGAWGETQAALFLERRGFTVIERNYHSTQGEIDIVARRGVDYYFIEVKTRTLGPFATDLAVTPAKLRKLRKTIRHYSYHRNLSETSFIIAGILVAFDRRSHRAKLRLVVFVDNN